MVVVLFIVEGFTPTRTSLSSPLPFGFSLFFLLVQNRLAEYLDPPIEFDQVEKDKNWVKANPGMDRLSQIDFFLKHKKTKVKNLNELVQLLSTSPKKVLTLELKWLVGAVATNSCDRYELDQDAKKCQGLFRSKDKSDKTKHLANYVSNLWMKESIQAAKGTLIHLSPSEREGIPLNMHVRIIQVGLRFVQKAFVIDNAKKLAVLKEKQGIDWETTASEVYNFGMTTGINLLSHEASQAQRHFKKMEKAAAPPEENSTLRASAQLTAPPLLSRKTSLQDVAAKKREERMANLKRKAQATSLRRTSSTTTETTSAAPGNSWGSQPSDSQPAGSWGKSTTSSSRVPVPTPVSAPAPAPTTSGGWGQDSRSVPTPATGGWGKPTSQAPTPAPGGWGKPASQAPIPAPGGWGGDPRSSEAPAPGGWGGDPRSNASSWVESNSNAASTGNVGGWAGKQEIGGGGGGDLNRREWETGDGNSGARGANHQSSSEWDSGNGRRERQAPVPQESSWGNQETSASSDYESRSQYNDQPQRQPQQYHERQVDHSYPPQDQYQHQRPSVSNDFGARSSSGGWGNSSSANDVAASSHDNQTDRGRDGDYRGGGGNQGGWGGGSGWGTGGSGGGRGGIEPQQPPPAVQATSQADDYKNFQRNKRRQEKQNRKPPKRSRKDRGGSQRDTAPAGGGSGRGRGRGANLNLPAWMTEGGGNPDPGPQSARDANFPNPDASTGGVDGALQPQQPYPLQRNEGPPMEGGGFGRGRGRGANVNLPAWMTANGGGPQRANGNPFEPPETRGGNGSGGFQDVGEGGNGRGRGRTLPAWMTQNN